MEATQEERIALMVHLRATGVLPRYQVRIPSRFTTLADRRSMASMFGPRVLNTNGRKRRRGSGYIRYKTAEAGLDKMRGPRLKTRVRINRMPQIRHLYLRQHNAVHRALGLDESPTLVLRLGR